MLQTGHIRHSGMAIHTRAVIGRDTFFEKAHDFTEVIHMTVISSALLWYAMCTCMDV